MAGHYASPQRRNSSSLFSQPKASRLGQATGSKSHLFRPPLNTLSPSNQPNGHAASKRTTGNEASFAVGGSRKRSRPESRASYYETPQKHASDPWNQEVSTPSAEYPSEMRSPIPFVNTQYAFAGGLDTPTRAVEALYDNPRGNSPDDHFRRRWSESRQRTNEDTNNLALGLNISEDAKPPIFHTLPSGAVREQEGWGKFVFNLATTAATRVFSFCTSAAAAPFKGFHAGGGQGYDLDVSRSTEEKGMEGSSIWEEIDTHYDLRTRTPLPGHYPVEFPFPVIDSREVSPERDVDTPPRPAKRLQTDSGWVVVDRSNSPSRASSPRLSIAPTPSRTISASRIPRLAPTQHQQTPSSRKSLIPVSRRSSGVSQYGSPAGQASYASPRRPTSSFATRGARNGVGKVDSPLSPDAQRYADRIEQEEWENDESMRKLNAQLTEMIKEGQDALNRKPDVSGSFLGGSNLARGYKSRW